MSISVLCFGKSLRVIVPQTVGGVQCYDDGLCIDSKERLAEARALYSAAAARVTQQVGAFHSQPKIVFCSSAECLDGFGLGSRAAFSVGNFGVAVAPRGWKEFYIAHELIHVRQAEEFGNIAMLYKPKWMIEGMAYSLSGDPRHPLTEPFESWRARFEVWNKSLHGDQFWQAANKAE
ncbi:MAG: hypothetical protein ACLPVW_12340 [Terriglobales bacterium]